MVGLLEGRCVVVVGPCEGARLGDAEGLWEGLRLG